MCNRGMGLVLTIGVRRPVLALSVILEFQAAMVIRRDPALSHADIEKIMLVSSTWYHTLTTWLEVPPSNEREMKAICERTLVIWKRYGDALGLDRVIEKPVVFSTSRQCGWKTCLCYQMDPAHRMKLCKGCFLVYYCSKHCQKK
ncbi:hypothetical protein BDW22DRAFT_1167829 [Trametopsis cervina]|nr:hypothetical protein BDW22DRAFT_1167829 [Trametopsis cervina]